MRTALVVAIAVCSFGLAGSADAADAGAAASIHNYEAPGNLESRQSLDCIGADKVKNTYTPVDLQGALTKCLTADRYEEGAFLYAVAGVYGRFDTYRVEDKTAHQAANAAMFALHSLSEDKKTAFQKSVKEMTESPERLAAVCKEIVRIGPPDYYPRYMIRHGMDAMQNALQNRSATGDGLVKDFDAKAAWQQTLASYLHCPGL